LENKFKCCEDFKTLRLSGLTATLIDSVENYSFLSKGTQVSIGFSCPASACMFDFSCEVPVVNPAAKQEHHGIGVPWHTLTLV